MIDSRELEDGRKYFGGGGSCEVILGANLVEIHLSFDSVDLQCRRHSNARLSKLSIGTS